MNHKKFKPGDKTKWVKKLVEHYSGPQSIQFWNEVNKRKDDAVLYSLDCDLQNLEDKVLTILNAKRSRELNQVD